MSAFLVTVAALVFWCIVGRAVLVLLWSRRRPVETFLLAPMAGVAVTVVGLFVLNRLGFPIRWVGWPLSVTLLVVSALVLWKRRPTLALRRVAPFACISLATLFLIGWPMFRFGFDWVSYGNDDGSNYALWAHCVLEHGWYDPIKVTDLSEGRDGSRIFVFASRFVGERPGSQMLLAWLASVSGSNTLAVLMPLLLALHGVMVLSAGGLVYRGRWRRLAALTACVLVGLSAPLSLGTLNQLLGQTGGLALLCGSGALLYRPVRARNWRGLCPRAVLLGLTLAGVLIYYCELVPFLGLGFVIYLAATWIRRRRRQFWPALTTIGGAFLVALVLVQDYLFLALGFIFGQMDQGASGGADLRELFPYYLHPSGLASLWSFQCFHVPLPEPWLSRAIIAGGILLLLSACLAVRYSLRAQPAAILCGIMLALTAAFYVKGSAFALFKLAMYTQPFLLGTLALGWAAMGRWRWAVAAPLVLFAFLSARTQHSYAEQSFGQYTIVEMKSASEDAVFRHLRKQIQACNAEYLIVASESSFTAKMAAMFSTGRTVRIPTYPYLSWGLGRQPNRFLGPETSRHLQEIGLQIEKSLAQHAFDLHDPTSPGKGNLFIALERDPVSEVSRTALVYPSGRLSLLNRHRFPETSTSGLRVRPLAEIHNHLVLVNSNLGKQYYVSGGGANVAMYQIEPDFFYPGLTMASLGRHLLFEVLQPDAGSCMLIDVTTSLAGNGDCRLPDAAVIGAKRMKLPLTGRGAARVISEPVPTQFIGGRHYLALDMGERSFQFAPLTGTWDRFGRVVIKDRRKLSAFGRDISLLSPQEHKSLKPPTLLADPKQDVRHPDLEFSGFYEDGWLSEHAWFRPSSPGSLGDLVVEGSLTNLGDPKFQTELTILVDGREVIRKKLEVGPFSIREPLGGLSSRPKVELLWSQSRRLSEADRRIVTAQLFRLGFEKSHRLQASGGK